MIVWKGEVVMRDGREQGGEEQKRKKNYNRAWKGRNQES